jgi:adenylate cyclase
VALAWSLIFYGRHKDAAEAIETARRLDPKNPNAYLFPLGVAKVGLERFQEAIVNLERVRKLRPDYLDVNVYLAASYAHLGRIRDAEEALNRYTDVWKTFASNVDGVMEWWPYRREVDLRLIGNGLVEAGLCCEELLEQYVQRVRSGGTLY